MYRFCHHNLWKLIWCLHFYLYWIAFKLYLPLHNYLKWWLWSITHSPWNIEVFLECKDALDDPGGVYRNSDSLLLVRVTIKHTLCEMGDYWQLILWICNHNGSAWNKRIQWIILLNDQKIIGNNLSTELDPKMYSVSV